MDGMLAAFDLEQQNWVQGFLQRTHAVLEVALRKAAEDALQAVAMQAVLLRGVVEVARMEPSFEFIGRPLCQYV